MQRPGMHSLGKSLMLYIPIMLDALSWQTISTASNRPHSSHISCESNLIQLYSLLHTQLDQSFIKQEATQFLAPTVDIDKSFLASLNSSSLEIKVITTK